MTEDEAVLYDGIMETDQAGDDDAPEANGILRCLSMLAEEAAVLHMPATLAALRRAMNICGVEAVDTVAPFESLIRPAHARVH